MRRTLVLVVLVAVGVSLLVVVRAPERPTGRALAARGHRVLGAASGAVRTLTVELGERRLVVRRTPAGWELDGRVPTGPTLDAVTDLVTALTEVHAVDAFPAKDLAAFGLDPPRGVITVETTRRTRRLRLGAHIPSGATFYAYRDGDRRVMQVGTGIESALERAFHFRDHAGP